jgi:beta-N-acetylhexosaminidase
MKWILFLLFSFLSASEISLEEKIGSLFIIPICPKEGIEHWIKVKETMKKFHISSVLVKKATPEEQIKMLEYLGEDIFVFQDAEWGLGMRMENTFSFPKNKFLAKLGEESIYQIGKEIGRELKMCGCHVNLAPVVDINSNPKNIIIGDRAFSEDPIVVAKLSLAYAKGLMDSGIMAVCKHFPGHGDVEVDSHKDRPVVYKTEHELFDLELIPFTHAVKGGVEAIMTAHLSFPNLRKHPIEILRNQLHFDGLVISDAMNMKGVKAESSASAIDYLKSGHDMLLYGSHLIEEVDEIFDKTIPEVFGALYEAAIQGEIEITKSCERISNAKSKWLTKKTSGNPNDEHACNFHKHIQKLLGL